MTVPKAWIFCSAVSRLENTCSHCSGEKPSISVPAPERILKSVPDAGFPFSSAISAFSFAILFINSLTLSSNACFCSGVNNVKSTLEFKPSKIL